MKLKYYIQTGVVALAAANYSDYKQAGCGGVPRRNRRCILYGYVG